MTTTETSGTGPRQRSDDPIWAVLGDDISRDISYYYCLGGDDIVMIDCYISVNYIAGVDEYAASNGDRSSYHVAICGRAVFYSGGDRAEAGAADFRVVINEYMVFDGDVSGIAEYYVAYICAAVDGECGTSMDDYSVVIALVASIAVAERYTSVNGYCVITLAYSHVWYVMASMYVRIYCYSADL